LCGETIATLWRVKGDYLGPKVGLGFKILGFGAKRGDSRI